MLELIRHVGREFGISIVISTHLMGDVERTCDAVIVLDAGKVLRTGAVAGLTEETETILVDLVEGAAELASHPLSRVRARGGGSTATGPRCAQISGDDYDVLRDAIVDTGVLLYRLAPKRHTLATCSRGRQRQRAPRALMSVRREIPRPRLPAVTRASARAAGRGGGPSGGTACALLGLDAVPARRSRPGS